MKHEAQNKKQLRQRGVIWCLKNRWFQFNPNMKLTSS